eukprot:CAMPEP_0182425486 /NCGR_PEP_ID=MMETSP1167-20130531/11931_1 /TAXON_ID=2988 /ORGANISM="Mallomonas Sp, Strain CCMP3275" /LENGTH=230 /DNA_ID=CAMNT_0024606255 /DNA_START=128 /DNA_END=820 /DNA_ORIENTATION=+
MDRSALDEVHKLVLAIIARPESGPFREAVDWRGLGLVDYPTIIKHPMDLGTIKTKLESNSYSCIEEVAADMRLVWTNCMTYNQDGSEYYQLADTFAKKFEEKYALIRRLDVTQEVDPDRIPSLEEKTQLSYDIFKIETAELGRVLTIIEKTCPGALNRRDSEDEVLVNLDGISPSCFHEVAKFVSACTSGPGHDGAGRGKKRIRTDTSNVSSGGGTTSNTTANIQKKKNK